jgi:hypothetical protein
MEAPKIVALILLFIGLAFASYTLWITARREKQKIRELNQRATPTKC